LIPKKKVSHRGLLAVLQLAASLRQLDFIFDFLCVSVAQLPFFSLMGQNMEEQIRILCVDDEKNVLSALQRSFLEEGYEVLSASSGEEGLSILMSVSPVHVVISDYRMPEMNGIEFLREVRRRWPDMVRIVLTAYADVAVIISSINEGQVHHFLLKPWTVNDLKTAISKALERYFLHKKNIRITDELLFKIEELKQANFQLECLKTREKISVRNAFHEMTGRILDSLPAGVAAIDHGGFIIYCNNEAGKYMVRHEMEIVGTEFKLLFPGEVTDFVESSCGSEQAARIVEIDGAVVQIRAVFSRDHESPAAILLLLRDPS
jgi:two-component system NtrC family sensor kinase